MVVKTECEGLGVVSLDVGAANALRYFSRKTAFVNLQLGDLSISCKLMPDFWTDRPRICDPRLGAWLKYKVLHPNGHRRDPVAVKLIPNGENCFRIETVSVRSVRKNAASQLDLPPATSAMEAPKDPGIGILRIPPPFPPLGETSIRAGHLPSLAQAGW